MILNTISIYNDIYVYTITNNINNVYINNKDNKYIDNINKCIDINNIYLYILLSFIIF